MSTVVLMRGAGDLASGVAVRLHRSGFKVILLELPEPLVVRRKVSFAEAVFEKQVEVEGITARLAENLDQALGELDKGRLPVIIDLEAKTLSELRLRQADAPIILVDGRMTKKPPGHRPGAATMVIGLGPGFTAGLDCDAVIETNRGHHMGRVLWQGSAEQDTGIPENVLVRGAERVIRAPADGVLSARVEIGDQIEAGQVIAEVSGLPVYAPFRGVMRGLLHPAMQVKEGMKIGDLDPRNDPRYCYLVSEKALAVGGGVLEAILSRVELRNHLWD